MQQPDTLTPTQKRIALEVAGDMRRALVFGQFLDAISQPTPAQEWLANVKVPVAGEGE